MPLTKPRPIHEYEVGEEVVVRLEAGRVFEVVAGDLAVVALPAWTIAEVVSCDDKYGVPQYALTFAWAGAAYRCTVPESAIDGTA